uniref:Mut7-C RNAse domain-containing protein n=1 Tax=Eptatretus burgeri TaxID=7764 RepID=A0A8C4N469_EPTBU
MLAVLVEDLTKKDVFGFEAFFFFKSNVMHIIPKSFALPLKYVCYYTITLNKLTLELFFSLQKSPQVPGTFASVPESKLPKDMAVVCDNMLQGLGRYLRCLGIDVRILENEEDHRAAAEYARVEGRIILTCGLPFQTLRSQVGEGRCMLVECTEKARVQAKRVLQHYNVCVTPADIFSRCQVQLPTVNYACDFCLGSVRLGGNLMEKRS